MPLTEEEKVAVRHHLGFLNVSEMATFVLGTPAGVQTQFIVELAMNKVLERALPRLRRILMVLEGLESQMEQDHELLAVLKVGEIEVNEKEQTLLTKRYDYWVAALCNLLGIPRNPYDQRMATGGINVRVQH